MTKVEETKYFDHDHDFEKPEFSSVRFVTELSKTMDMCNLDEGLLIKTSKTENLFNKFPTKNCNIKTQTYIYFPKKEIVNRRF